MGLLDPAYSGTSDHEGPCDSFCFFMQGVLVAADLTITSRWEDGVVGVPSYVRDYLTDHDCLPVCAECNGEIEGAPL